MRRHCAHYDVIVMCVEHTAESGLLRHHDAEANIRVRTMHGCILKLVIFKFMSMVHTSTKVTVDFFTKKVNVMILLNLHSVWWIYEMYVCGHFLCKIY